jgi:hypothetical protein
MAVPIRPMWVQAQRRQGACSGTNPVPLLTRQSKFSACKLPDGLSSDLSVPGVHLWLISTGLYRVGAPRN